MFRVDPALDGVALDPDVLLLHRERRPGGDADLLVNQVDAGDHLGDRMLHLDAGVHLDEIELAVLVEELDRSGAGILQLLHRLRDDAADALAHLGIEGRGGTLLPDLLVAALERAIALAEMDRIAPAVAENLDLDMARLFEVLLDIDRIVAEGGLGFRLCGGERMGEVALPCGPPSCRARRRPRRP